jgi:S1-C subfamily serine protease
MKKIVAIISILFIALTSTGQKGIEAINGFKFAYLGKLTYGSDGEDIYGVISYLRNELSKKGLIVLNYDSNKWPIEAKRNSCLIGTWIVSHSEGGMTHSAKASIVVKNCKDEVVYESNSWASHFGYFYPQNTLLAIKKAFSSFRSSNYSFNQNLTPKIEYPTVDSTEETEKSLKTYFDTNKLDPIEGIYKGYQSDGMPYYKIGIKKREDKFIAIVLETDIIAWKAGEIKAYFEPSSIKGFYSTKWYMGNKTITETFGNLENEALLTIEFKDAKTEKIRLDKFLKMYPVANGEISLKKDNSKASGSGFFLTTDGIIATNAHVIADANSIQVSVANEIGSFSYKAKVLLVDTKNDVALLKIADETFKDFTAIPYGISEKADVGESVFTIGYPLNDIMGSNYKVNDGIISAKTGIEDDLRYYQISVPLQPGNSGGPLFDKTGNVIGITSAKLNSKAVGTDVENVNYAIKSSYFINIFNMLPDAKPIISSSGIGKIELQDQVKLFKNYVCLIKVF